ncbi:MAG: histidine kinase [Chthoniobacter sp.]|jgi:signal transduction histidine kinase|nr:histidine kinase [Chthoniobacter sp.]
MSDHLSHQALAAFFCERREQITSEWLERVREERSIPASNSLPREELMDHLPNLFDHLTDQLRAGSPTIQQRAAARDAQAHGEHRWQQNYRLDELLREVAVLRRVFMRHLVTFQCAHPEFVGETEWSANRIVHGFFDGLLIDSTTEFVARQKQELFDANASLEAANTQIRQFNERLIEVDERRLHMLRTISHEVRNHLNAITFVVQVLASEANPSTAHEYYEMLSRNLVEISALMNQLLDFATLLSGGERVEWERCNPSHLYNELALALPEMARNKGLAFGGTNDPTIGEIFTDRNKLRRIVMNLAMNAIKYTRDGEVRLNFLPGVDGCWVLEVTDTGPGIPQEERQNIFEEFHRVAATTGGQPGVGLGLAITKQLIELLRGRIEVHAPEGGGTVFRVLLPRDSPEPRERAAVLGTPGD